MTQIAMPREVYDVREAREEYVRSFAGDARRVIEIGRRYRHSPERSYCTAGCPTCVPGSGGRCWQRRTELTFVYRVRELLHTDWEHGLGRFYLVTLVKPDVWQMRAFTMGEGWKPALSNVEEWHTRTGIVVEAQLGEEVE